VKILVGAVVLVLVLGFAGFKSSEAPIEVTCGNAHGGTTLTARGVEWAKKAGGAVHEIADHPDQYRDPAHTKEVLDGIFRKTLWYWFRTLILSSRGQKLDPQILKLERDAEKQASAAEDACTPCPDAAPQDAPTGADPASLSLGGNAGTWSDEQAGIAKTAIAVGKQIGVPQRGWVVAIAAGWQESGMRNLTYGDRDSLGWLQQRASWGTVKQRMNPTYAARKFYEALKKVNGWQQMPVTVAAQRVQISAYPSAYAKHEGKARAMAQAFADQPPAKGPAPTPAPEEAQCVTPQQQADGTVMATVAGARKVTDVTSGTTYQIPIPAGPRGVAINFALDQVAAGKWYQFGAAGPDRFDCSGLVSAAWGKAGVHFTAQTEVMVGELPSVATAQPGDLLRRPGHVQIYLGKINGQTLIAEAPRTGSRLRVRPQWMTPTNILDPTKAGQPA
jgi:cell wall-associated NlpC family hydrolase